MPMRSQAQRAFLHTHHPKIADRWEKHTPKGKKLPEHVKKAFAAVALPSTPSVPMPAPLSPAVAVAAAPTIAKLKAQAIYKVSSLEHDQIAGGKADNKSDSDFDPKQVAKGMKVEREHTTDPAKAKEITEDHLTEFDRYYTALDKMEEKLKEGKTAAYGLGVKVARFWVAPAIGAGIGTLTDSENRLRGALRGGAIGAGVSVGAHLGGRAAGRLLVNDKTEAGIEQAYRALRAAGEAGVLPPPGTLQTVLKPGAGILGGRLAGGVAGGLGVSYLDKKLEPYSKIR